MVDAVSGSSSLFQAKFSRTSESGEDAQLAKKHISFGPAFNVELSDEAKEHLADHKDIFAGLSAEQSKKLYGALGKIDELFQTVGDREPSEEEEKKLAALEEEVVNIIGEEKANKLFEGDQDEGEDLFANLSETDSQALESILDSIGKIFDQVGDRSLDAEHKKRLETLAERADTLLGSETAKLFREELNEAISERD
ncbi:MAG: hypothetical protein AB3N28_11490 [Kordiimonas sp.]